MNYDPEKDFISFDAVQQALEGVAHSIMQLADGMAEALAAALGEFRLPPPPDNLEDLFQQIMVDNHIWDAVDFDRLTPEQRWEYQKWVWGAPKRWLSRLWQDSRKNDPA